MKQRLSPSDPPPDDKPEEQVRAKLRNVGLRPTAQRIALGALLFDGRDRHMTAEMLHAEARDKGIRVSVATVYNTLHQFTDAGLLKAVAVDGSKTFFDTNTSDHHHFYSADNSGLIDIPGESMRISGLPEPPPGMAIERIDVIVRMGPIRLPRGAA